MNLDNDSNFLQACDGHGKNHSRFLMFISGYLTTITVIFVIGLKSVYRRQIANQVSVIFYWWAVCVAQLVEQSLPIPEVRGSNPVSGEIFYWTFTVNCFEKTKIKKKEAGNGRFFKNVWWLG